MHTKSSKKTRNSSCTSKSKTTKAAFETIVMEMSVAAWYIPLASRALESPTVTTTTASDTAAAAARSGVDEYGRILRAESPRATPSSEPSTTDGSEDFWDHKRKAGRRNDSAASIRDDVHSAVLARHNIQEILKRLRRVILHPLDRDEEVDTTRAELTHIEASVLRAEGLWVTLDRDAHRERLATMRAEGIWRFLDTRPYFVQLQRDTRLPRKDRLNHGCGSRSGMPEDCGDTRTLERTQPKKRRIVFLRKEF